MKFGLEVQVIENIISVLEQHPKVDKGFVFGSRAKGNYRPDSDIDIAIKGNEITTDDIIAISVAIETIGITHKFDLIDYNSIKEPALKEHIDRVGIVFYSVWQKTKIGILPTDWKLMTLDEIKSKEKKAIISGPFGSNISSQYFVTNGVPVIRGNNLSLGLGKKFNDDGFVFITEEKANELGTWAVKEDIIFTAVGTIGQVGILLGNEKYEKYIISNKQLRLRVDKEIVSPLFAYYWFASPAMIDTIEQRNTGSSVPLINLSVLKSLYVPIPPKWEQNLIVQTLGSLDNKIDLLHRQNKTLEQLAETLFRQWFVEEAEESWEIVKLEKLGKIICGKTPSKKIADFFNGDIPFIKIPDMHGKTFVFDSVDSLTEKGLNSQLNKTIPPKSICVSCIATVGLVVMNAKTSQTNQQINSIIPAKDIYRYFIYLKMLTMKDDLLAMASGGTATDNLNTGDFSKIDILLPNENQLKNFHETVNPLFEKIYTNQTQISTLTQARDTLLPKLMSGEVRVEM
ncbi:MAG TPA: restriction endonuclease subunit S [Paludibacter sp.]